MSGQFYMSIEPKEWTGWRPIAGLRTNARAEVADILSISLTWRNSMRHSSPRSARIRKHFYQGPNSPTI
jgi:hypothetical protein